MDDNYFRFLPHTLTAYFMAKAGFEPGQEIDLSMEDLKPFEAMGINVVATRTEDLFTGRDNITFRVRSTDFSAPRDPVPMRKIGEITYLDEATEFTPETLAAITKPTTPLPVIEGPLHEAPWGKNGENFFSVLADRGNEYRRQKQLKAAGESIKNGPLYQRSFLDPVHLQPEYAKSDPWDNVKKHYPNIAKGTD